MSGRRMRRKGRFGADHGISSRQPLNLPSHGNGVP